MSGKKNCPVQIPGELREVEIGSLHSFVNRRGSSIVSPFGSKMQAGNVEGHDRNIERPREYEDSAVASRRRSP